MDYLKQIYTKTIDTAYNEMGTGCYNDQWQWDQGVMLYGLVKAHEKTKDKKIYEFMKYWIDYHLERRDFGLSINTTAPLLGVVYLLKQGEKDERYTEVCKRFADWCMAEAPRADLGTFEHSCTANKYPNQIWADTLFMGCLFLVKWGKFIGEDMYIKEAVRQFCLHYHFLSDSETGLIYHGYDCNVREHKGVFWGRGNCWLAAAGAEVLNIIGKKSPMWEEIYEIYKRHIWGVLKFQDNSGGWHTVIDRADTYIEMSATAAFAFSVMRAVNSGLLDEKYRSAAEKAYSAVTADIKDGAVIHGSMGTCVMEDYRAYNDVKFGYTYFTQGLALMLFAEKQPL